MTLARIVLLLFGLLFASPTHAMASPLADHETALSSEVAPEDAGEASSAEVSAPVTPVVSLSPPYSAASPLPQVGRAMYYNPGVMGEVLAYRLKRKQVDLCFDCVGYAALLRAGDLNRRIWLQWEDGEVDGPFLVIDVAAHHHIPSLLARDWVVDVDYRSAQRRGMNRPLPVTVLAEPPPVAEQAPSEVESTHAPLWTVHSSTWACIAPALLC